MGRYLYRFLTTSPTLTLDLPLILYLALNSTLYLTVALALILTLTLTLAWPDPVLDPVQIFAISTQPVLNVPLMDTLALTRLASISGSSGSSCTPDSG